ncbi:hypothetical protein AMJ44_05540 [candidate division WOR-1 bacterium DG_54_3]|uniref:SbsA Ig-like domain-containing protein n=1 Tax=candidate division WOR-1 bacterium DG_54_3 TaxID=1703775 RepID=A0A0S7Y2D0_UNCSA|nr:MAG: hypothetical protein AMJ44_05540 [candidate division WOR-1 bacterium DG_54_3]
MLNKFALIGIVGIVVAGCGEQTPGVKIETASPQNLVCKGIVYGNYYMRQGSSYGSHVIGSVAGAMVTLVGSYETKSAVTNADGEYVFEKVKYGNYVIEVTKEGYQRGEGYLEIGEMLMYGSANASSVKASNVPDGAIFTVDLDMGINPVMRSVSPLPNSTIETDAVFTITFNKPIDTATVRPSFVSAGVRTFAAGDTVGVTTAWSDNDTVLTITPTSSLLPNEVYMLYLGLNEFADVKDKDGYKLASSTSTSYGIPVQEDGNVIENNDYFTYYTASGGAPGAPSYVMVAVNSKPFVSDAATGADYIDVYTSGNSINLYCDPPSSGGPITGYKFYAAIDAASATNYVLLSSTPNNYYTGTVAQLITALYGSGSTVDPISTQNYPFINKAVYFKAVTYNGEGESTQEATTGAKKELVGPQLNTAAYSGRAGGGRSAEILNNNYHLPALIDTTHARIAYIAFNQPIDPNTISASYFSHTDSLDEVKGTVTDATHLTSSSSNLSGVWPGNLFSIVQITTDTDFVVNDKIKVITNVKDLAGNPVVSGTGDEVSIP